jgi:hypothetical protein
MVDEDVEGERVDVSLHNRRLDYVFDNFADVRLARRGMRDSWRNYLNDRMEEIRPIGPVFQDGSSDVGRYMRRARAGDFNFDAFHSPDRGVSYVLSNKREKRARRISGKYYGFEYDSTGHVSRVDLDYWHKIYRRHYGPGARVFPSNVEIGGYPYFGKKHALHWQYSRINGVLSKWKRIAIGWLMVPVDSIPASYVAAGGKVQSAPPIAWRHFGGFY